MTEQSEITPSPTLTPSFCFNQTALRDFLRISRHAIDDSIAQNLNALLAPGNSRFDPTSTARRIPRPVTGSRHNAIDPVASTAFKNEVLFPSWQSRADVLSYCAGVATSPDPDDPEHVLREIEDVRARERVVDERLDPYSGRYFPREARTESLAALIRNERMVEGIVRQRTWGMVRERCGDDDGEWGEALDRWRRGNGKSDR